MTVDHQGTETESPRVKVIGNSFLPEGESHADNEGFVNAAMAALGTQDRELAIVMIDFLVRAQGKVAHGREPYINAALSALHHMAPQDITEALLISQMIAVHANAMTMLAEAVNSTHPDTVERYFSMFLKLARIYVAQMDALRKYRKCEQTTSINNFNVSGEAKAMVGNFINATSQRE